MEFGKLNNIENVNWSLPADEPASMAFLKSLPSDRESRFYIGTPAWGHREWVGKIYTAHAKAADYLSYYAQSFNTIELNTTHYRIPTAEQCRKWQDQVSAREDFLFCPKVFQGLSHAPGGLHNKTLISEWLGFLKSLQPRLGPCFLQLPPHFDYSKKAALFYFLEQWPSEFPLSLEFRHPTWLQGPRILPALEKYLRHKNIGLVITDVAGRRDLLHTSITADFVLLRFIGNDLHPTDFTRAESWSERFATWTSRGLSRVFFFAHEPDDIHAPELAQAVVLALNENCAASLPLLQWQSVQTQF